MILDARKKNVKLHSRYFILQKSHKTKLKNLLKSSKNLVIDAGFSQKPDLRFLLPGKNLSEPCLIANTFNC
jgi:hypothetical protein